MAYIYNLTDTWNAAGTTFSGIKMAVTNTASSASSKLLDLTISGATTGSFFIDRSGSISTTGSIFGSGTLLNMTNATSFFPQTTMWNQTSDANAGYYILQKSRGASGAVQVNDFLGTLIFKGYDASGNSQNSATVAARATAVGASSVDASLSLVSLGSTGFIGLNTNGSERMRITSDGRVGIGATPSNQLLVLSSNITGSTGQSGIVCNSTIQPDVTASAVIYGASPSTAASATLGNLTYFRANQNVFGGGTVVTSQFGFLAENSLTGATNNYGFYSNIAAATGRWNFYANGTAANHFRGRVLVTSDTSVTNIITPNFQVNGTGADAFISATRWANAAGSYPGILLGKSRGASVGSFTLVNSGDSLGELSFTGDDGVAFQKAVQILAGVDGVAAAGSMPGNLRFLTTPSGSTTPTERMRIDSAGNVGIGTTSFGSSAVSVVSIGTGTAPTTGPADTIQLYSTDLSAGNTMLSLYTEGTPVNVNATAAATHRIAIRVNGTVYYLLANTSA